MLARLFVIPVSVRRKESPYVSCSSGSLTVPNLRQDAPWLGSTTPATADHGSLIFDHGRGCGVGRGLGVALGVAVAVGEGVGGMVSLGVGVGLGKTVAVAVAVAVGEGDAGTLGVAVGLGGIVPVGVGVGVVAPQGVALDAGVGETVGVGGGVPTAAAISIRPQPKTLFGGPAVPHSVDEIKTAESFKASRLG